MLVVQTHLTIKKDEEGLTVTYPTFNDVHTTLFKTDGSMVETKTHYSDKIVEVSKHRGVEYYKAHEMVSDLNDNFYFSGYEWIPNGKEEERVFFINKVEGAINFHIYKLHAWLFNQRIDIINVLFFEDL